MANSFFHLSVSLVSNYASLLVLIKLEGTDIALDDLHLLLCCIKYSLSARRADS